MILNVTNAEYRDEYKVFLTFNNGQSILTDLEKVIFADSRKIFLPLRDVGYFSSFSLKYNTIVWDNEADFAPEFLLELGIQQESVRLVTA